MRPRKKRNRFLGLVAASALLAPIQWAAATPSDDTVQNTTPAKPGDDYMDPKWEEARVNIRWVFEDRGARANYFATKAGTRYGAGQMAKYWAVLHAQKHNRHAQQTIEAYGPDRTIRYILENGWDQA